MKRATYRAPNGTILTSVYSDMTELTELLRDEVDKDLSAILREAGRRAKEVARETADGTFAVRDSSRRRHSSRFRDSFHSEARRPVKSRRETKFQLDLWSDHPAANILEDGRVQAEYEIDSAKRFLVWPDDNVSAVTSANARRARPPVTWSAEPGTPVMEGYHVMEYALEEVLLESDLIARVGVGAARSKRSGNKRRGPRGSKRYTRVR